MPQSRVPRQRDGFIKSLAAQREMLENAAARFDEGSVVEAQNLAVRIRILLHDGSKPDSSLLAQIGVRDTLPYVDTAPADPPQGAIALGGGLCIVEARLGVGGTARYAPPLDDLSPDRRQPEAAFVDWWNDPIVTGSSTTTLTRRRLVLWVANQDGGAHVDPRLDETYERIAREGLETFQPSGSDKDLALPSIRQIAHELQTSVNKYIEEDTTAARGFRVNQPICPLSIHQPPTTERNDPCPCGSGRKTKRCFGMRQPRRREKLLGAS